MRVFAARSRAREKPRNCKLQIDNFQFAIDPACAWPFFRGQVMLQRQPVHNIFADSEAGSGGGAGRVQHVKRVLAGQDLEVMH